MITLFLFAYLYKYDNVIRTIAILEEKLDTILIYLKMPFNNAIKIKQGNKAVISFNNCKNIEGLQIETKIQSYSTKILISNNESFNLDTFKINKYDLIHKIEFQIIEQILVEAVIIADKTTLFSRLLDD